MHWYKIDNTVWQSIIFKKNMFHMADDCVLQKKGKNREIEGRSIKRTPKV